MQPIDVYRQHRKIIWGKKWNKWCTDYVAVLSSSKPHFGWCNRNSANSLSVRSENPRASSLSLQRLKTNPLKRIDFKQPGSFGLPTRRRVMAAISSYTHSLHRTKFMNIYWIFTKYLQTYTKRQQKKVLQQKNTINVPRRVLHQGWKWAFNDILSEIILHNYDSTSHKKNSLLTTSIHLIPNTNSFVFV